MKRILILLSLSIAISADTAKKGEDIISQAEIENIMKESSFVMPSAGALANSLNSSLGDIDWSKFIDVKVNPNKKYSSNGDRALTLGVKGADSYFLAISKDKDNLISVSSQINLILNDIILNGRSLNTKSRKKKLKKLKKLIKRERWSIVSEEIAKLKESINRNFLDNRKENLSILNSIGGWLEGYRLAVEGFRKYYNKEESAILLQEELIDYLLKEVKKRDIQREDIVSILSDIRGVLAKVKGYELSKEEIEKLSNILSVAKKIL